MTRWPLGPWQVRSVLNAANLSTPLGLVVGLVGRVTFRRGPRGLLLGHGYRLPVPVASAFTVGDVVLTRHGEELFDERPRLLAHEERHAWQYAASLGLPFLVLYVLGAAWSWVRTGHPAMGNPFERLAGLADGGYPTVNPRRARARRPRSAGAAA
jgi:hypothetical protein